MQNLRITKNDEKRRKMLLICIVTGIIVIPLISASVILTHPINKSPQSLQQTVSNGETINLNSESNGIIENLINYLDENEWGAKYFVVATLMQTANKILLSTSKAFMVLGGGSGVDRVLTMAKFRETLRKKEMKLKNEWDAFVILKNFSEMKDPLKLYENSFI